MSFLGNNRPDLLKSNAEPEATPRSSDTRFIGEVPSQAPEPPSFGSDRYTSTSTSAPGTNSNDAPLAPDRCTNVVAAGARWKGTLKVEDSARIDGVFSGEVDAKGTVHVSEGAEVDAKIHAAYVVVSGTFRGEIRAERKAELMPTSRVSGEVMAKALSVHEGAILDGTVQMTDAARPASSSRNNNRNGASPDAESTQQERRNRSEATAGSSSANGSGGA
jgi:cytoskeletal protein CcmA (bactofilin family)